MVKGPHFGLQAAGYGLQVSGYRLGHGLRDRRPPTAARLLLLDHMRLSRRQCLFLAVPALLGGRVGAVDTQGLDQFMTAAGPPCSPDEKLTPAVPADATYKKGSPARTSLAEAGMAGTPLDLSGTVSGITCGRIKGAVVDVW